MWVARSKRDNRLSLFQEKPKRCLNIYNEYIPFWITDKSCLEIDSTLFPHLRWEDEPVEVSLIETFRLQSLREIK